MAAVGFLRPRLGIGGAERLVLDAAIQLQRRGCRVQFYVPDAAPAPEFTEVRTGMVAVERVPSRWPEHVGGRLRAAMGIARTKAAARALARSSPRPDLVFCDLVSHVVPLVKRLTQRPVLFFCHFPDLLLTPESSRALPAYRVYRRRLDWNEEEGLRSADRVIVNSAFTAAKVTEAFPGLGQTLTVVHPGVPMKTVSQAAPIPNVGEIVLLSVSRFDPRKNLELAIEAMAALRSRVSSDVFGRVRLVMSGGYDESLPGQVAVLQGLRDRAAALEVSEQVRFVLTPESEERDRLLAACRAVLYTPVAEHFGIVPLEAMAAGRPVVAVNHGGPTETVTHDRTGFLCPPDPQAFAGVLATLVTRPDVAEQIGGAARDDVRRRFSIDAFGDRLWNVVEPMLPRPEA
jgi:alpha-1,3/alpha-1,6-mannosyltransferase